MKSFAAAIVVSAVVLVGTANARPLAISKPFETDKTFGVGLAVGVPSGLTGKYLFTSQFALDFGAGGYYAYRDRDGLHLHGDILWHPFVAVEGETFLAPFYLGLGGRVLNYDDITHLGIRIPLGVAFDFKDIPVDVFLESALVVDVSVSEDGKGKVDFNGLIGLRYYL
ncbi:MAG: hypothetical protein MJE77_44150 [Proteobacteria bacterium]|nr:hypothetical protein [Pseudomonadota bacterium]